MMIKLILFIIIVFLIFLAASSTADNFISSTTCSVFILNYNRPDNIPKLFKALKDIDCIDKIVVRNGHPDYIVKKEDIPDNRKLVIHNDFDNVIGCARRYDLIRKTVDNEYVLILDDDFIPSKKLVKKMLSEVRKQPYNIYGCLRRTCTKDGYSVNTRNYNLILPGMSMTSMQVINDYLDFEFNKYLDWFKKYKGNCEDIAFNLFLLRKGIKPKYVTGDYKELDSSNGYSSKSEHYKIRNEFCKIYSF